MSFLGYFSYCYRKSRGSIFIGGLVGGMFLSFLMDTSDSCAAKEFMSVFFYISLSHFGSLVLGDLMSYGTRVCRQDDEETWMEKAILAVFPYLLHIMRSA